MSPTPLPVLPVHRVGARPNRSESRAIARALAARGAALVLAATVLVACQSGGAGGPLRLTVESRDAVATMQRINEAAQRCWVRSGDRAFRSLRVVPELDTVAGKPRILILRAGAPSGLPQLVIEAEPSPVRIATYGPLANKRISARINRDLLAWSAGGTGCA